MFGRKWDEQYYDRLAARSAGVMRSALESGAPFTYLQEHDDWRWVLTNKDLLALVAASPLRERLVQEPFTFADVLEVLEKIGYLNPYGAFADALVKKLAELEANHASR